MINKFLCKAREIGFWSVDRLRGSATGSAYNEIKKIDGLSSEDNRVGVHQRAQFIKLVEHAVTSTDFYSSFDKNTPLEDFPIINKNLMIEDEKRFLSKNYEKQELFPMSSSGSTGIPFTSYQDYEKKKRVNAEIIYYSEKAGYSIGKNLVYLRAVYIKTRKSSLRQWIQNESIIDISSLNDNNMESVLRDIVEASKEGSMLLAYGSTFDLIRDYSYKNNLDFLKEANISGIISNSEMLYDDTREAMGGLFHCKVLSRYSNQENGVLGQDEERNNVFIINEANYIVEIFHLEEDRPVEDGILGRIVITDLYNKAMAMIRYDTGDIGSMRTIQSQGRSKKAITNFGGRKVDMVFDCFGKRLSPHLITNAMWAFPEIKQYQFIQESERGYRIIINVEKEFQRSSEFKEAMISLVGSNSQIIIEKVDEIPIMESRKRRYIMNKMDSCPSQHRDN
ncbi:MAG: phenylacetate--CoA ligase family protein [Tissierellia bacterium]|nr:phenylacetate--CoA ligase family protein [Tissierellia bacterium]